MQVHSSGCNGHSLPGVCRQASFRSPVWVRVPKHSSHLLLCQGANPREREPEALLAKPAGQFRRRWVTCVECVDTGFGRQSMTTDDTPYVATPCESRGSLSVTSGASIGAQRARLPPAMLPPASRPPAMPPPASQPPASQPPAVQPPVACHLLC